MFRRTLFVISSMVVSAVGIATGLLYVGIWPTAFATTPDGPSAKDSWKRAEALSKEWTYNPGDPKPPSYGSETNKAAENIAVVPIRLEDPNFKGRGIAGKEWFKRAAKFYADKCGAELNMEKPVTWQSGLNKAKARYAITDPFRKLAPASGIAAQPNELFFLCDDASSTVTVTLRQQGENVVVILVTAAVR